MRGKAAKEKVMNFHRIDCRTSSALTTSTNWCAMRWLAARRINWDSGRVDTAIKLIKRWKRINGDTKSLMKWSSCTLSGWLMSNDECVRSGQSHKPGPVAAVVACALIISSKYNWTGTTSATIIIIATEGATALEFGSKLLLYRRSLVVLVVR